MSKLTLLIMHQNDGCQFQLEDTEGNFPFEAVKIIQQVLDDNEGEGKKYPANNWRSIPLEEHLSHARQHIQQWISHRTNNLIRESQGIELLEPEEDDIAHALCRMAFAAELIKERKK